MAAVSRRMIDQIREISSSPEQEAMRLDKLANCPRKHRKKLLSAWLGRSRKAAINAACLECLGWNDQQVGTCTSLACPLYPYRTTRHTVEINREKEDKDNGQL